MKKFFAPLTAFVVGMILLALSTVFYPAINTATTTLASNTSGIASNYWGFSWAVSSTRLILFLFGLGCILFDVGWVWLHRK